MEEENRHNYEYEVDLNGDTAPARVVRMIGQGKRVLEIGAGPGSITRHLKETGNCTVTALEVDEEAIKKLSPFCEKVYSVDLNDPVWPELLSDEGKFEIVLAADVLEHLYDPWATLEAMKNLITDDVDILLFHCRILPTAQLSLACWMRTLTIVTGDFLTGPIPTFSGLRICRRLLKARG